ncbi:hypothetical protein HHI36_009130 [Cryptolaemus montrouzieri]|uniref:Uncharacterized protein n=1 Tax=Cryptolaemus montrouzieri TaxID=559131 RepID=A0ABD2MUZ9_9CUCU
MQPICFTYRRGNNKWGPTINIKKPEFMVVGDEDGVDLDVGKYKLRNVESFKYLEVTSSKNGKINREDDKHRRFVEPLSLEKRELLQLYPTYQYTQLQFNIYSTKVEKSRIESLNQFLTFAGVEAILFVVLEISSCITHL